MYFPSPCCLLSVNDDDDDDDDDDNDIDNDDDDDDDDNDGDDIVSTMCSVTRIISKWYVIIINETT